MRFFGRAAALSAAVLALSPSGRAEPTLSEMLQWRAAVPLIAAETRPGMRVSPAAEPGELLYVPKASGEPLFGPSIEERKSPDSDIDSELSVETAAESAEAASEKVKIY